MPSERPFEDPNKNRIIFFVFRRVHRPITQGITVAKTIIPSPPDTGPVQLDLNSTELNPAIP